VQEVERMPGILYVVATPIGNLEDVSPRALHVLRSVSCIACEDTRRTSQLLARYGIRNRTLSYHRHNERARGHTILEILQEGGDVALVSDGGTPALSDPGAALVAESGRAGVRVVPVPGPSAAVALLSASGLPADRFVFEGFLPHRAGERRRRLRELADETRTIVVFEAPHRIRQSLADLAAILGERSMVLGRELTKVHEAILRGSAKEIADALDPSRERGEIVLAIAGRDEETAQVDEGPSRVLSAWNEKLAECGGDVRAALRATARELGIGRAELYRLLVETKVLDP
jgi:16S rRNA (cytidine1402-2'-O)-methyltransferase